MGQDWGGRSAANPPGVPRVTAEQVRAYAEQVGVEVKRDGGWSQWWIRVPGDVWRTGMTTNFLMLQLLRRRFPAPVAKDAPTHWLDDRGLSIPHDWREKQASSDYRAVYTVPCVKKADKLVPQYPCPDCNPAGHPAHKPTTECSRCGGIGGLSQPSAA